MKILLPRRPLPVFSSGKSPLAVRRIAKKLLGIFSANSPLGSTNVFISSGAAATVSAARAGDAPVVVEMRTEATVVPIMDSRKFLRSLDWNSFVALDEGRVLWRIIGFV